MDLDTREWHDGILTQAARAVTADATDAQFWIICDGDIDPEVNYRGYKHIFLL
jgi:dynein heavy chain 2